MKTRSLLESSIVAYVALGLVVAFGGCASTKMTSTWTDPSAKGASLSKVAVVCLTKDPAVRRMTEDTAASQLAGAQAVPSYQVVDDADIQDRDALKGKLLAQGFQGVLLMQIAGVTERMSRPRYGVIGDDYAWGEVIAYRPTFPRPEAVVHVVSDLYSLQEGKVIWSGVSQTFNPATAKEFMASASKAVAKAIQKDRLVL